MMLKEIRFKNWKSFRDATLYFDPLTVLIGANASGKSNALDGIEFLQAIAQGVSFEQALQGNRFTNGIRGGIEWATLISAKAFSIELSVQVDADIDLQYSITVNTLDSARPYIEKEALHKNIVNQTSTFFSFEKRGDKAYLSDSNGYTSEIPYTTTLEKSILFTMRPNVLEVSQVIEEINKVLILDPVPSQMRGYVPISDELSKDASNLAGVLASLKDDEKITVEKSLAHYARQLPERDIRKVYAEPVGKLAKDAMLYCEEEWLDGQPPLLVDASGMSDGTLRFIAILTALLTRPEGSQIIIEEVDNGLHPSRAGLLLNMLKKIGSERNIDVLVTTHNPALLDALGPEMVPFVVVAHRSQQSGESQLTLLEDIQNLPKLLASGPIGKIVTKGEIEKSLAEGQGQKDHE